MMMMVFKSYIWLTPPKFSSDNSNPEYAKAGDTLNLKHRSTHHGGGTNDTIVCTSYPDHQTASAQTADAGVGLDGVVMSMI